MLTVRVLDAGIVREGPHPGTEVASAEEGVDLEQAKSAEEKARGVGPDDPGPEEEAVRRINKASKDYRPDLPQVVIGMAATAEGVPVRCWTFPGNTSDRVIIRAIEDDLVGWMLNRVVWVADSAGPAASGSGFWPVAAFSSALLARSRSSSPSATSRSK